MNKDFFEMRLAYNKVYFKYWEGRESANELNNPWLPLQICEESVVQGKTND